MRGLVPAVVLLSFLSGLFGGKAHRKSEEGNRHYEAGEHDEALRAYTEAQVPAPEAPELHYDIGNVLYRKGEFEGAGDAFRRAVTGAPPVFLPDASYNFGNSLFRAERYDEAAAAYRRTLEARPDDADARRNLELALRALEAQKQSQQQPEAGEDDSGKSPSKDSKEPSPDPPPAQERPQPQPRPPEEMRKEQAERLLDRIAELEKEAMRKRAPERAPGSARPEKDW